MEEAMIEGYDLIHKCVQHLIVLGHMKPALLSIFKLTFSWNHATL